MAKAARLARFSIRVGALAVGLGLSIASAPAQEIEPEAAGILRSMADHLAGLKAFTAEFDVDDEVVDTAGQKLQYSASGSIAVERPGRLHFARKGSFVDAEMIFDGSTISIWGKKANVYVQIASPGPTIDEAVEEVRAATGLDASGADLFAADPYSVLTEDVVQGVHVGTGIVGGVECDHLAFRNPRVDWQIWIQKGGQPLPMKYVITTKWVTGAPQYTLRLKNWNVAGEIDQKQFEFTVPPGATKLDGFLADAIGEFSEEAAQ